MAASVHTTFLDFGHILATFSPCNIPNQGLHLLRAEFEFRRSSRLRLVPLAVHHDPHAGGRGSSTAQTFFSINGGTPVAGWFNDGKSYEIWSWG
jgi:hypothetical protein